jgi:pheromone shutdown protein TraB
MTITIPVGLLFLFVAWLVVITVYPAGQQEPAHRLTRPRPPVSQFAKAWFIALAAMIALGVLAGLIDLAASILVSVFKEPTG